MVIGAGGARGQRGEVPPSQAQPRTSRTRLLPKALHQLRNPMSALALQARDLARVAPGDKPRTILMKIDMYSDLLFLGGRNWDRTSDPSLVRRKHRQNPSRFQARPACLKCRNYVSSCLEVPEGVCTMVPAIGSRTNAKIVTARAAEVNHARLQGLPAPLPASPLPPIDTR